MFLRKFVLGVVAGMGLLVATIGAARADYTLTNLFSQKAAEVPGSGTVNGIVIVQNTPSGAASQKWKLESVGNGLYRIRNTNSGKVIEVYSGLISNGAPLVQNTYTGAAHQLWYVVQAVPGTTIYRIVNAKSGKVMENPGYSLQNGTILQQFSYNGGTNQHWLLDLVP